MLESEADTGFPERGGGGCHGYGYFMLGHFVAGHVMRCTVVGGQLDQHSINRRCHGTIAFGHRQLLEID